jgi:hypothetical protein
MHYTALFQKYRISLLALTAILLITSCSNEKKLKMERKNFFQGVIVDNSGDSVPGQVKLEQEYRNKIQFYPENSKKKMRLSVDNVSFMRVNYLRFKKIQVDGKLRLLEQIAHGEFNLYGFSRMVPDRGEVYYYFVEQNGVDAMPLREDNFTDFVMKNMFHDSYIREKVETRTWGYENIVNVFRKYNSRREGK